jgi:undecaprenyl-diphosphatase
VFDNPLVRAIILGIVQGLTEFLPVSSSGHLVAVPYLFSWPAPGLAFNVAMHVGTLVAVVWYFASDLWWLASRTVGLGTQDHDEVRRARRAVSLLAIGTLPAAALGALAGGLFAEVFEQPLWVAGFWLFTAGLLLAVERVRRRRAEEMVRRGEADEDADLDALDVGRPEGTLTVRDVAVIGGAQALALLPGISRSGATIAAGMGVGLTRSAAARFSFLLSIPVIAGAALSEVPALFDPAVGTDPLFGTADVFAGMVAAGISGYWAIRFLLRLVQTDDLLGFARYLVLAAALLAIGYLWLGPPGAI